MHTKTNSSRNQNKKSSARLFLVRRLIYCTIIFVGCAGFLGECEDPTPAPPSSPPDTVMNVGIDRWVFVEAGGSASLVVDSSTNNTRGRPLPASLDYTIEPIDRYDPGQLAANFSATYTIDDTADVIGSSRAALLTINTDPSSQPGTYLHEVDIDEASLPDRFDKNPAVNIGVVVVPTGGSIKTGRVARLAAGWGYSLAVLDDGTVWAWGDNEYGQLGDGTRIDRNVPVQVQGLPGAASDIAAGENHSMALVGGNVWTWGFKGDEGSEPGSSGRLGPGRRFDGTCDRSDDMSDRIREFPHHVWLSLQGSTPCDDVTYLEDVIAIAAGQDHSLALRSDGRIFSWGNRANGQSGRPEDIGTGREIIDTIDELPFPARMIAAGEDFSLAVIDDGTVWGWGRNNINQLGFNNPTVESPNEVPFVRDVQLLKAGRSYALTRIAGEPGYRAWGANAFGQLGDGTTSSQEIPQDIATHLPITQIDAGWFHGVATLPNGDVYTWGNNTFGETAGASTESEQLFAIRVTQVTNVSGIAAGGHHTLARDNTCGTVTSWGQNFFGQLGRAPLQLMSDVPLSVYGLGESGIGANCRVSLHIFQQAGGRILSAPGGFDSQGCAEAVCGAVVDATTGITLTAMPDPGFDFAGWRGDCQGGNRNIQLTMNESKNCFADYTVSDTPPPVDNPPTASFVFSPTSANVGDTVSFDAGASSDDNGIISYEWDFEDDGAFDAMGVMPSFVYAAAGTFTVRLRVTDSAGQVDEATATVDVTDVGTPVFFSITVIFGGSGNGVVNVNPPDVTLPDSAYCDGDVCVITDLAAGESYTLTPTATDPLSSFAGWETTECDSFDGNSNCIIDLQSDRVVTATFISEI